MISFQIKYDLYHLLLKKTNQTCQVFFQSNFYKWMYYSTLKDIHVCTYYIIKKGQARYKV